MEDFILGLLWWILDALLEGLFEFLLAGLCDLGFRALGNISNPQFANLLVAGIFYGLLGFGAGELSLIFFPHPLIRASRVHGINLLVSPLMVGIIMSLIGSLMRKREKRVLELESFGYGFAFAFGIALTRFLLAR